MLLFLAKSSIDYVAYSRDRDGRFGDVGGEYDLASVWWCGEEGFRLFGGR